jgi:hypothetical protein
MAASVLTSWVLGRQKSFLDAGGLEPAKDNIRTDPFAIWTQMAQIQTFRRIVYTSRFSTAKPNLCNRHIYHFQSSESLNLMFFSLFGGRGGRGGGLKGSNKYTEDHSMGVSVWGVGPATDAPRHDHTMGGVGGGARGRGPQAPIVYKYRETDIYVYI